MIIADKLRTTNRAEYILYMWQIEDLLRAYKFNIDELREHYLSKFKLPDEKMHQTEEWYSNLCNMMQEEGLRNSGHLQIIKNAVADLEDLHRRLLQSSKFPYYREMYYRVLPYIVELRAKNVSVVTTGNEATELETCFNALYGTLILRLRQKSISSETLKATKDISTLLGQLSDYYLKDKEEPLDL